MKYPKTVNFLKVALLASVAVSPLLAKAENCSSLLSRYDSMAKAARDAGQPLPAELKNLPSEIVCVNDMDVNKFSSISNNASERREFLGYAGKEIKMHLVYTLDGKNLNRDFKYTPAAVAARPAVVAPQPVAKPQIAFVPAPSSASCNVALSHYDKLAKDMNANGQAVAPQLRNMQVKCVNDLNAQQFSRYRENDNERSKFNRTANKQVTMKLDYRQGNGKVERGFDIAFDEHIERTVTTVDSTTYDGWGRTRGGSSSTSVRETTSNPTVVVQPQVNRTISNNNFNGSNSTVVLREVKTAPVVKEDNTMTYVAIGVGAALVTGGTVLAVKAIRNSGARAAKVEIEKETAIANEAYAAGERAAANKVVSAAELKNKPVTVKLSKANRPEGAPANMKISGEIPQNMITPGARTIQQGGNTYVYHYNQSTGLTELLLVNAMLHQPLFYPWSYYAYHPWGGYYSPYVYSGGVWEYSYGTSPSFARYTDTEVSSYTSVSNTHINTGSVNTINNRGISQQSVGNSRGVGGESRNSLDSAPVQNTYTPPSQNYSGGSSRNSLDNTPARAEPAYEPPPPAYEPPAPAYEAPPSVDTNFGGGGGSNFGSGGGSSNTL